MYLVCNLHCAPCVYLKQYYASTMQTSTNWL